MAKPMPTDPPVCEKIAVLMPTSAPRTSTSGPPELPGFTEASVWMKSSYGPLPMKRSLALTMPVVTVCSSPNGLPIAITGSPTSSRSESPNGIAGNPRPSIFSRARSVLESLPTSRAWCSAWSARRTTIASAPRTTWKLVTM
jgi:hypothetical protein